MLFRIMGKLQIILLSIHLTELYNKFVKFQKEEILIKIAFNLENTVGRITIHNSQNSYLVFWLIFPYIFKLFLPYP